MSGNTNDDGPSRWGTINRSREEGRGYSISDGNKRRRDDPDRYDGRHDDSYYGRGYEQRSRDGRGYDERPRHSYGRRGGYDHRYERPRADSDRGYHEQQSLRYEEGRDLEGRGYDERSHYSDFRGYDKGRPYSEMPEWKCTECGLYNSDVYEECDRCGSRSGNMPRNRSASPKDDDAVKVPETPKWPPPFESGGAAYNFHAASGMFYESISDFFYDPKTKLYYGNKQKVYYTHRPDHDPPFCALDAPPTTGMEENDTVQSSAPKVDDKKKIAISLKTTTLPGQGETKKKPKTHKASKKVKVAPPEPKKQEKAKLELWAERGKEIRNEAGKSLPMTTTNKPICLLCRRKFASIEKLKKHEELSALHKENLEKKKASEEEAKKAKESEMAEYRDRALERRIMHGPETSVPMPLPRDLDTSTTREAEVVRPEDSLGASNIGNQMLQKLGWKSGSSLGRGGEGEQAKTQSTLVKDWEKIETLASSGHQSRVGPSSGSGVGN